MRQIIILLTILTVIFGFQKNICLAQKKNTNINYTDKSGLKQGLWKVYLNGKLWKQETYLNNKLHGKCFEYFKNGDVEVTNYVNGVRQGYFLHYEHDSTFALFVTYWEDGKKIWSAFPWELKDYIVPIKGFIAEKDSVEIKVPYNSGKIMYEGMIVSKDSSNAQAVGIHKAYYETGELKAIVDYNKDTINIFSLSGKLNVNTTIEKWKGHRLE